VDKEKTTANQIARMIAERANVGGTQIVVRRDTILGWNATIIAERPEDVDVVAEVEKAATELRQLYDLAE
jgi:hypothetical protein